MKAQTGSDPDSATREARHRWSVRAASWRAGVIAAITDRGTDPEPAGSINDELSFLGTM